jgi:hypothetical protein
VNACNPSSFYQVQACDDVCGALGLTSKGCVATTCQCDKRLDVACDHGARGYCACKSCTGSDQLNAYVNCYLDDPAGTKTLVRCFSQYVDAQGNVDCNGATSCGG